MNIETPDHAALLTESLILVEPVIAEVSRLEPDAPTPCDDMNRGELLAHLNAVSARILTMGTGGDARTVPGQVPVADYPSAWHERIEPIGQAWSALRGDEVLTAPWGQATVTEATGTYVAEILVHTWDLASTSGVAFTGSPELAAVGIAAYERQIPPATRAEDFQAIRDAMPPEAHFTDPFGPAVEVGPNATPMEQLIALSGRQP